MDTTNVVRNFFIWSVSSRSCISQSADFHSDYARHFPILHF